MLLFARAVSVVAKENAKKKKRRTKSADHISSMSFCSFRVGRVFSFIVYPLLDPFVFDESYMRIDFCVVMHPSNIFGIFQFDNAQPRPTGKKGNNFTRKRLADQYLENDDDTWSAYLSCLVAA